MTTLSIVFAVVALIVGIALGFFFTQTRVHGQQTANKVLETELEGKKSELSGVKAEYEAECRRIRMEADANLQTCKTENAAYVSTLKQEYEDRISRQRQEASLALEKAKQETEQMVTDKYVRLIDEKDKANAAILREKERAFEEAITQQRKMQEESMEALKNRFDESARMMQEQLKNATSDMLKERQQDFEKSSREGLDHLLNPLKDNLARMREAVTENTAKHNELGGKLSANIADLSLQSQKAKESADRLANALRNGTRAQGQWGETVLTELLESQGLQEGIHFVTQGVLRDEKGDVVYNDNNKSMRPDVILHLDKYRDVIIDSKVSLSAYMDYVNAETEEIRRLNLRQHVDSIQKHVKELVAKDYSAYVAPPKVSVGYVIMFVPCTAALNVALQEKPDLWRKAMEQNVYIADEQTLYAALKIVNLTWQQIAQAENHKKVYELADEMTKRVNAFIESYKKIGKSLEDARKAYDAGYGKLDDKGQSIPQTCRKLLRLGAKLPPKSAPELLYTSDESESLTPPQASRALSSPDKENTISLDSDVSGSKN